MRPKALVPFCGVPLLDLIILQLKNLCPQGIVVNACYMADQVTQAAGRLAEAEGMEVLVSKEDELLNHGGGLRKGVRLLPAGAEHVLVHNVDVVSDIDIESLVEFHLQNRAAATVALVPKTGPLTVDLQYDQRVSNFRCPPGEGGYTFAGVHVFRREILEYLPTEEACSIIVGYEAALKAGLPVLGYPVGDALWSDIGTQRSYIRAHAEVMDCGLRNHPRLRAAQEEQARRRARLDAAKVRCTGAMGIGKDVKAPPGAHLHNVVLWDDTVLTQAVLYADSVFVGGEIPAPPDVDDDRRPDPRVYASLKVDPEACQVSDLRKQGSGRKYCRISTKGASWVWCAYSQDRPENASFAAIAHFLEGIGVRVPQVELHLGDTGEVVSRDLGRHDLQAVDDADELERYLVEVARQIALLHVRGDRAVRQEEFPLQNGFTKGLYDWERNYFREHILDGVLGQPDLWGPVAQDYRRLRTMLLLQPQVPVHRDLQSANIMVVDGTTYLIDFQGMRLGCAAYDLGALLYDPYKCHPIDRRRRVWLAYKEAVRELGGEPPADKVLHAAATQRLLQALGAYGKLWHRDGLGWYRQFILPALHMLVESTWESGEFPAMASLVRTCLKLAVEALQAEETEPG